MDWRTKQSKKMSLSEDEGQQVKVHFTVNAFLSGSLMVKEMKYSGKLLLASGALK